MPTVSVPGVPLAAGTSRRDKRLRAHPCDLFYELHGEPGTRTDGRGSPPPRDTRPCIVFVAGLGATANMWCHQVDDMLRRPDGAAGPPPVRVLTLDNRGCGRSGSPRPRGAYSTAIMAGDVLAVLDHVGWHHPVHVVGHSMGGMVCCKLAAAAPERVASLTIISATAGGFGIVPTHPRAVARVLRLFFARDPVARAEVDLKLHFAAATLDAVDEAHGRTRRDLLREEYLECATGGAGGQPRAGFLGQLAAAWRHRVQKGDVAAIRAARLPVLVVHGRADLLAPPARGAGLAARLGAAYVELEGAHFVTRERGPEVTALLRHALASGPACAADPHRDLAPRRTPTPPPAGVAWIAAGMGATAPLAVPACKPATKIAAHAAAAGADADAAWRSTSPTSALDAPRTPPRPLAAVAGSESACPLVGGGCASSA